MRKVLSQLFAFFWWLVAVIVLINLVGDERWGVLAFIVGVTGLTLWVDQPWKSS